MKFICDMDESIMQMYVCPKRSIIDNSSFCIGGNTTCSFCKTSEEKEQEQQAKYVRTARWYEKYYQK